MKPTSPKRQERVCPPRKPTVERATFALVIVNAQLAVGSSAYAPPARRPAHLVIVATELAVPACPLRCPPSLSPRRVPPMSSPCPPGTRLVLPCGPRCPPRVLPACPPLPRLVLPACPPRVSVLNACPPGSSLAPPRRSSPCHPGLSSRLVPSACRSAHRNAQDVDGRTPVRLDYRHH